MAFCGSLISLNMSDVLVGKCGGGDGERSWSVKLYAGEST